MVRAFFHLLTLLLLLQVLALKTDSGHNRNPTFVGVQLAYLALAKELDLDALIVMRTAPGQSYVNPCERVMSVLSMLMQGIATARGKCSAAVEKSLQGVQSMKGTRKVLDESSAAPDVEQPSPKAQWAAAMQVPIDTYTAAFQVCCYLFAHLLMRMGQHLYSCVQDRGYRACM